MNCVVKRSISSVFSMVTSGSLKSLPSEPKEAEVGRGEKEEHISQVDFKKVRVSR